MTDKRIPRVRTILLLLGIGVFATGSAGSIGGSWRWSKSGMFP
jgi:hypothetical protein